MGPRKAGLTPPPPVIVTGRPKAVLSLRFPLFYVWCCSIFESFNFNTSAFVWFSKDGGVATCLGKSCRLGLSTVILLFVGMCLSIFPFDVWDKLWVLIRSVPEVFLLI